VGEKNDLLSAVASDNVVDCVGHLVEYLSCRVFGQAMYRHVTDILSRKAELQSNKKLLGIILHINKDGKIRYNHP
jgi:hypothetical protein